MSGRYRLTALALVTAAATILSATTACSDHSGSQYLRIAAAPDPKGDITKFVITLAKQQGVDLSLVTTTNSVNDHQLLEDGDV
ncbi:hypothetical protein, partial [Nocardia sp. NPDC059239]|uniref:hypothetical protein n=1 Tax=Nocardia sp. NPDC059239 TaxID=3346785 RepID=UPI0036CC635E